MTVAPSTKRSLLRPEDRQIARLAIPAFGALIAEPLYALADTAVVGRLGTPQLAGLSIANTALLTAFAVMIFLAYGTTAAVARLLGAGDERSAAHQGVQGVWLAFVLGVGLAVLMWILTEPILTVLGAAGEVRTHARIYLRISVFGLPAMLVALAGVGYLRGLQDTVRPLVVAVATAAGNFVLEAILIFGFGRGIGASALSTVIAQWVAAATYVWWIRTAVTRHGVSLRPDPRAIARLARVGGDLLVRTLALRGSFTVGIAAAARIGDTDLAAHEIVFQLWFFVALALDAVAIAGQAMIGHLLGADRAEEARRIGRRMIQWGLATGAAAAILLLATRPLLPRIFTDDPEVIALAGFLLLHMALMQPLNGVVFALDGVLIGAGDLRFLAWAMWIAAGAFVPLALLVPALDAGIGWLWGAVWVLMAVRAVTLLTRFASPAWQVTGTHR